MNFPAGAPAELHLQAVAVPFLPGFLAGEFLASGGLGHHRTSGRQGYGDRQASQKE